MTLNAHEPVIDAAAVAAKVAGTITGLGSVLALFGFSTETDYSAFAEAAGTLVLAGGGVVAAILPIVQAFKARARVTPLVEPKTAGGEPLVPLGLTE